MSLANWLSLLGLTFATFIFNTSEFVPIGLLTDIKTDFPSDRSHRRHAHFGICLGCHDTFVATNAAGVENGNETPHALARRTVCRLSVHVLPVKQLRHAHALAHRCGMHTRRILVCHFAHCRAHRTRQISFRSLKHGCYRLFGSHDIGHATWPHHWSARRLAHHLFEHRHFFRVNAGIYGIPFATCAKSWRLFAPQATRIIASEGRCRTIHFHLAHFHFVLCRL